MISKKVKVLADTVTKLLLCNAEDNVQNILQKSHVADIAYVLSQLGKTERLRVFQLLGTPR